MKKVILLGILVPSMLFISGCKHYSVISNHPVCWSQCGSGLAVEFDITMTSEKAQDIAKKYCSTRPVLTSAIFCGGLDLEDLLDVKKGFLCFDCADLR
jgi:hypothetical protein